MKSKLLIHLYLGTAALTLWTMTPGCGPQISKQGNQVALTRREGDPLPLIVGIKVISQDLKEGHFEDISPIFAAGLVTAGLFKDVLYPLRSMDKPDVIIEVSFKGWLERDKSYQQKMAILFGTSAPYLILIQPLVGAAMNVEDHHKAEASVQIRKGEQVIKTYTGMSDVIARWNIYYSTGSGEADGQGAMAATEHLVDQLVRQIASDRDFYSKLAQSVR